MTHSKGDKEIARREGRQDEGLKKMRPWYSI